MAVVTLSVALLGLILSGEPVAPQDGTTDSLPPAPDPPTVYDDGLYALTVSWAEPDNADPAITGYDLEYRRRDSTDWLPGPQNHTGTDAVITGLEADKNYHVRVRALNANGAGSWSEPGEGTTALYVGTMSAGARSSTATDGYLGYRWEPQGGELTRRQNSFGRPGPQIGDL